jgi:hypothetical protein
MRKSGITLLAIAALLFRGVTPVAGQTHDWRELTASRDVNGVRAIDVSVSWAVGELRVFAAGEGLAYDTRARYDANRFRLVRKWNRDGGRGHLRIGVESVGDSQKLNLDDLDDGDLGFLGIGLSPDVPTSLEIEVGAAKADLELGDVALTRLAYRTGASETVIRWSTPNVTEMDSIEMKAGAADFEARDLGNARFRNLEFEGAVGDVTLDFSGAWDRDATATIRMGLGSLHLVVPAGLGVRIVKDGFLAKLDAPGFDKSDGAWTSPEWSSASQRLEIDLEAALGSIEVDRVE